MVADIAPDQVTAAVTDHRESARSDQAARTPAEPASLGEILAAVARRAGVSRLGAMAMTGVGGALAIWFLLGRAGVLPAAGALAVGAYGVWGLADRDLNTMWSRPEGPHGPTHVVAAIRAIAAVVAALASLSFLALLLLPIFSGLVR